MHRIWGFCQSILRSSALEIKSAYRAVGHYTFNLKVSIAFEISSIILAN